MFGAKSVQRKLGRPTAESDVDPSRALCQNARSLLNLSSQEDEDVTYFIDPPAAAAVPSPDTG